MELTVKIASKRYHVDLTNSLNIAITLTPNQPQPNHFGAPNCTSKPLSADGFIGDTQQGGSCNVNQLTLVAHCNGTHTESVSHIVNEPIAVFQAIPQALFPAVLISLKPEIASQVSDHYAAGFDSNNRVITKAQIQAQLKHFSDQELQGLVIRTLPNPTHKQTAVYSEKNYPVYLSNDAMSYILERKVQHLMVDFPSVDKMYDQGELSNHRIFWQVNPAEKNLNAKTQTAKTISEMVFVSDTIVDGLYLCNLQVPRILTDAVPSMPVLYKTTLLNE
ncbi:cyclase family protein [Aliikangiella sp. IMCC44653]